MTPIRVPNPIRNRCEYMKKTWQTRLMTMWMYAEYYCYGKWQSRYHYFHPSSLEIVEIDIPDNKSDIRRNYE